MGKTLFIGNGPNRLHGQSNSWEMLLEELAKYAGKQEAVTPQIKFKPLTLVFEEICLLSGRSSQLTEIDLKRKAAKLVQKIPSNEFHERIISTGVRHIITTNYDYNLEIKSDAKPIKANVRKETKYSLFRRRRIGDQYIWHIHGEADYPNSLAMGHEQFSGSLQKMRAYITAKKDKAFPYRSPFMSGNTHFDMNGSNYAWVDVFLRDDIYILGFGLDYTEIDLWWLLSYKERLKVFKGYSVGETYFYSFHSDVLRDEEIAKLSILKSLGVRVHPVEVDTDYEKAYSDFLDDFENIGF